jgi:hypothetical protein
MRKNKSKILAELDKLDANAEQNPISDQELSRRKISGRRLSGYGRWRKLGLDKDLEKGI